MHLITKSFLAGIGLLWPAVAGAGTICGPSESMYRWLRGEYGEERSAVGTNGPNLIELFVNPQKQTVSMLITTPAKVSCIIVNAWEFQPLARPLMPAPRRDDLPLPPMPPKERAL